MPPAYIYLVCLGNLTLVCYRWIMATSTIYSGASVSVVYGNIDVGIYYQDGKDIEYGSLDHARELVAQMPRLVRKTLLAPIEQGLINPQSVFYLIADKGENEIAISVEDFVQLASTCPVEEDDSQPLSENADLGVEGYASIPLRLLEELHRKSEAETIYASIDNASSSGYSSSTYKSRSRGESEASDASFSSTAPILPTSRPPVRSRAATTDCCVAEQENKYLELNAADIAERRYLSKEEFKRKISAPPAGSAFDAVCSTPMPSGRIPSISFNDYNNGTNKQEYTGINFFQVSKCRRRLAIIIGTGLTIAALLAIGIFILLKFFILKENLTTTTIPQSSEAPKVKYDCVNGSITRVRLDGELYPLIDLNIPGKYPTMINGSLEYLFVPQHTDWWYAQKYCIAWCGSLVSIKSQEENDMILEYFNQHHQNTISNYWIGLKAWSNEWYLDDESNITYYNFPDLNQTNQDIIYVDNQKKGCVIANSSGLWSILDCRADNPFFCERNTADPNIRHTPFAPHQEQNCQDAGGMCRWDHECVDGHAVSHLCPDQPTNIICCIPKKPKPAPVFNLTTEKCTDFGGVCNHVIYDQCRGGRVVYDLKKPCLDGPRRYDCCIKDGEFA